MKSAKVIFGVIAGLLFAWIGYIYATHTAQQLPHFFPGYDASLTRVHDKHAIASFIVAAGFFVYAWFGSGQKSSPSEEA